MGLRTGYLVKPPAGPRPLALLISGLANSKAGSRLSLRRAVSM